MNSSAPFQFPLRNLLLMTVPFAVAAFAAWVTERDAFNLTTVTPFLFAFPAAIGALRGGVRGMFQWFVWGYFILIAAFIGLSFVIGLVLALYTIFSR